MALADFTAADLAKAMDVASDDIKRDVSALIEKTAGTVKDKVQSAFPVGPTGNLRKRVTVGLPRGFGVSSGGTAIPARVVRAYAPHVHIWEQGTVQRRDPTRGNANRGRSPRHGKVFEAIAVTERQSMLDTAQHLLDRPREL